MKTRLFDLTSVEAKVIINLKEIPEEGQDFNFTREDDKLTAILDDVLKGAEFSVDFRITPAGNAFDMRGSFKSTVKEICSFCAKDIDIALGEKFHELLLVGMKTRCDIKGSETDFRDPDLSATQLPDFNYDLGAGIHEVFALAMPIQPKCSENCLGLCLSCGADLNSETCACPDARTESKKTSATPFSVLKDLKLN